MIGHVESRGGGARSARSTGGRESQEAAVRDEADRHLTLLKTGPGGGGGGSAGYVTRQRERVTKATRTFCQAGEARRATRDAAADKAAPTKGSKREKKKRHVSNKMSATGMA